MAHAFFRLLDDTNHPTAWSLDEVRCGETDVDDRDFASGRRLENPGALTVAVKRLGRPMALSFTLLDAPIATTRVADLIHQMAPGALQRFPVSVDGYPGEYEILNVVSVVDAIDRARSSYKLWQPGDGRPDKVGQFRSIEQLVIKDDVEQAPAIFRPSGWLAVLVVSAKLKGELERIGNLGVRFQPLGGGLAAS